MDPCERLLFCFKLYIQFKPYHFTTQDKKKSQINIFGGCTNIRNPKLFPSFPSFLFFIFFIFVLESVSPVPPIFGGERGARATPPPNYGPGIYLTRISPRFQRQI